MLRIKGHATLACDGIGRRDALTVGGLSLFAGLTFPRLLQAQQTAPTAAEVAALGPHHPAKARSVVLINLFGGPPHMDLFDLKPHAPDNIRGEFQPIATSVPSVQIGELLPLVSRIMDRATLIRTYSHRYNSHNPYNVLTGFDGGNDRENYFAKRIDHPGMGCVMQSLGMGPRDVPAYVIMPAFPGYSQALRRAGPYGGYMGAQHDPLFTVCDPAFSHESNDDYINVMPIGDPVLPSAGELPDVSADRLDKRKSLLAQIDDSRRALDGSRAVETLGQFQQQVFDLLTSSKTQNAFDLSQEPASVRDRYGRTLWGSSTLIARRLVEAGSTLVTVHWEAKNGNHWDLHAKNFSMCRSQVPQLDQMVSALVVDLEERGLLDSTLVVVMGEMGRTPKINGNAGRDHWPQCGFVLMFGGGTHRGRVIGSTDSQAAYPTDRPVSAGDLASTIYQLVGIDPSMTVDDLSGRPIHINHGGDPVWEAIA